MQLNLTPVERKLLRQHKIKKSEISDYAVDELEAMLEVSPQRARELYALCDFQRIPSIGIRFAADLIFLGYYSIAELSKEEGADLTDRYELGKGFRTDPCVEDQFRLAIYTAKTNDYTKNWWDFTEERKAYRAEYGYPKNRPKVSWYEIERN